MKLRHLLLGRKNYDKTRQGIKKQRHHFAINGPYSQSYCFSSTPVWMWELGHKEDQVLNNWCLQLWCWRKLLRVLWTTRSNQSILKEINSEYSLEELMMKLKLQQFWPPDWKSQLIGKDPDAGKDGRQKEKACGRGLDD